MNGLINAKRVKLVTLNKLENELCEKELDLKMHENKVWLGEKIKKCTNDNLRKAFVSNETFDKKKEVSILKLRVNKLKREIRLLDDEMKFLLNKGVNDD